MKIITWVDALSRFTAIPAFDPSRQYESEKGTHVQVPSAPVIGAPVATKDGKLAAALSAAPSSPASGASSPASMPVATPVASSPESSPDSESDPDWPTIEREAGVGSE
jgi:hypothetical protein